MLTIEIPEECIKKVGGLDPKWEGPPTPDLFDKKAWSQKGFCRNVDPDTFFSKDKYVMAKLICHGCPVKTNCLIWGLIYEEEGVWGETDENERKWFQKGLIDQLIALAKSFDLWFPKPHVSDVFGSFWNQ